jgi:DNA-binding HxlR family transcriptional regulator
MLTRRLRALVEAGLLERRRYCDKPPRDEYVLTQRGRDFQPVLIALMDWGNRHFTPDGIRVQVVNTATGAAAEPVLVDRKTGLPLDAPPYRVIKSAA